jgi:hypothetical protein
LGYADTTRLFHRQVVSSHTGGASDLTRRFLYRHFSAELVVLGRTLIIVVYQATTFSYR